MVVYILSRIIGYCRVSKGEQNLDIQERSIKLYTEQRELDLVLYVEKVSIRKNERLELSNAMKAAMKGDLFVVYKLDCLARSTKELYEITDQLKEKEVDFVSIYDSFDTSTPTGKAMFGMLAVFAEFERDIFQQRTKTGLDAARKRGRIGGRPAIDDKKKKKVIALFEAGESATDIAKEYNIGRATVYKIINEKNN
jgi:DNA invertase Pin-like site-specific DNA recombinase